MKTIFTLLLATFFTQAFAFDEGKLTITLAQQHNMQVQVDGRNYADEDDNTVTLHNIRAGYHTIKVYRLNNRGDNGRWERNNRRAVLMYTSQVYVKPNHHVDVMVNRFGKALIDERPLDNREGGWRNSNSGDEVNGYNQAMSAYDFNQLLSRVKGQWFGSGKMNAVKEAVASNYFNTTQVRQLLQCFSSDGDKLELARLAYRNTVDRDNYYLLYDLFYFQSSKDELAAFIRGGR